MINDLLNTMFFAAFLLNASFLCVSAIEVIFLIGNFNQKFSSTSYAFRMNDDFCLPKSFVFSISRTFNSSRNERVQNRLL